MLDFINDRFIDIFIDKNVSYTELIDLLTNSYFSCKLSVIVNKFDFVNTSVLLPKHTLLFSVRFELQLKQVVGLPS